MSDPKTAFPQQHPSSTPVHPGTTQSHPTAPDSPHNCTSDDQQSKQAPRSPYKGPCKTETVQRCQDRFNKPCRRTQKPLRSNQQLPTSCCVSRGTPEDRGVGGW